MKVKLIFALALLGVLAALSAAYLFGVRSKPQPPAFAPASNPYEKGIYANGLIESLQGSGENINLYPEVAGTVTTVLAAEGAQVAAGAPLLQLDDSVQRATTEQLRAQAEAAAAQVTLAQASLSNLEDQWRKQRASHALDARSVSRDALDTARHAVDVARATLDVAKKQAVAAAKATQAAQVLLSKYQLKAPVAGTVMAVNAAAGGYLSPQGAYDSYTGAMLPPVVMGSGGDELAVRCYVDEILIQRLPDPAKIKARMFIRGTTVDLPLEFVRIQHYVSPKIELSNQRTERVDVRVLPLVFKFRKPANMTLYPGQLVDVYIGDR
ncbi:MAG: biotin/lipoyl-binding protein [Betaproteobacteria bacterium]|nr:biotin/lipoyl-binding protein [Betaproteobacteria bacterium]MDE2622497.1 biotin/lipoyl-binding protein [Betaproteobacteria bacterium]